MLNPLVIAQGIFAGIVASTANIGFFVYISILLITGMIYSFLLSYLDWE
jgi:hypothetical protein